MASSNLATAKPPFVTAPAVSRFPRLYRAHISAERGEPERTVFVEASCHHGAIRKIANAVAALEMRLPDAVQNRIYNCWSAAELIDDGLSDDVELRLFETGYSGNRAISFVEHPLFLVADPTLIRVWSSIKTTEEVNHG